MDGMTLCNGTSCPIKTTCKRFADINTLYWQRFFVWVPQVNGTCEFHVPTATSNTEV